MIKKSLIFFIFFIFVFSHNNLYSLNTANQIDDFGIISLMYHRFDENKYPSTNIRMNAFKKHLEIIESQKIQFVNPKNFEKDLQSRKKTRKILLTIDDAFLSFYENAWPILKEKKIPFILFVNTREVGAYNYMNWSQIKEIDKEEFVEIGNHSHSHEYLVDEKPEFIKKDIITSIKIFEEELGKNSSFFSYPFGEYSNAFKNIIIDLGFTFAFGQHSGVIDLTKDKFELPRFPINEKYGDLNRFKTLTKTLPFKYVKILPEEKYLKSEVNPPEVKIEFIEETNVKNINCYSNEGNVWRESKMSFVDTKTLKITLREKFVGERGRINCSSNAGDGFWRWLGIQFVLAD